MHSPPQGLRRLLQEQPSTPSSLITLHGRTSQTLTCFPVCAAHRAALCRLLSFKLRSRNQQVATPRPLYRTWTSTGREAGDELKTHGLGLTINFTQMRLETGKREKTERPSTLRGSCLLRLCLGLHAAEGWTGCVWGCMLQRGGGVQSESSIVGETHY